MALTYLVLAALVAAAFYVNAYRMSSMATSRSGATFYAENPGPTVVLIAVTVACVALATSRLLARVRAGTARYATIGMVAAGVMSVAAMLGLLTVGPFLIPLAALLIMLALPMEECAR